MGKEGKAQNCNKMPRIALLGNFFIAKTFGLLSFLYIFFGTFPPQLLHAIVVLGGLFAI
jgi:hypothetical protein